MDTVGRCWRGRGRKVPDTLWALCCDRIVRMICQVPSCGRPRTLFKGSVFCDGHTCRNWKCANTKQTTHPDYCQECECIMDGCALQKSFRSSACYKHKCVECSVRVKGDNNENQCNVCVQLCNVIFCKEPRGGSGGQFCVSHTCEMPDCSRRRYRSVNGVPGTHEERFCREEHGCRQCHGYRDGPDGHYCTGCLDRCIYHGCDRPRPEGHSMRLYLCERHGCIQCHGAYKHRFTLLRERHASEYCKDHYMCPMDNCRWFKPCRSHGVV